MMEKIYAYSNKAGRHTVNSGKYLYLFFASGSCAANYSGGGVLV